LDLPAEHAEADLHQALLLKLRDFLIESGIDSVSSAQYPLQVGGQDFALDLLFLHRGLNSLVDLEL
jgi:predicted nuclease of restriction endonuclease-like (RecB) superfamily